jgi:hypothetical protein
MATASDELAALPVMPASTYPTIECYQIIRWVEWEGEDRPVVMRGALHCRIAKRGTARYYAIALLERYVRRLKITETVPARWRDWVNRHLIRVARKRSWWSWRWERTCANDLNWLVCEYSVLIDGVRHDLYQPEQMESVRTLARTARKYTGALPVLPRRAVSAGY